MYSIYKINIHLFPIKKPCKYYDFMVFQMHMSVPNSNKHNVSNVENFTSDLI